MKHTNALAILKTHLNPLELQALREHAQLEPRLQGAIRWRLDGTLGFNFYLTDLPEIRAALYRAIDRAMPLNEQHALALGDDLDLVRDQVAIIWRLTRANGGVA